MPTYNKLRSWAFLVALSAAALMQPFGQRIAQAQMSGPTQQVMGVIINSAGQPVPGCTVQLQNAQIGPSPAVLTNAQGFYVFPSVPATVQAPYILQVYWGPQLVFQVYLTHLGQQAPIQLR